jgi:hypothetical protein
MNKIKQKYEYIDYVSDNTMSSEDLLSWSYLPGIGAAFLSVYNWFQSRRGPKLTPNKFVTYGYWGVGTTKYLYIPILINNDGRRAGLVSDIKITFESADDKKQLKILRRVELIMDTDRSSRSQGPDRRDYKDIVPLLPVSIPANSGEFIILECLDSTGDDACIRIDQESSCIIEISYHNTKSKIAFPYILTSEQIKDAIGVVWLTL